MRVIEVFGERTEYMYEEPLYPEGTIRIVEKYKLFKKPRKVKQICDIKFTMEFSSYYNNWKDISFTEQEIITMQRKEKLNKLKI